MCKHSVSSQTTLMSINSLNSHNNCVIWAFSSPFYWCISWDLESLSNLFEVLYQDREEPRMKPNSLGSISRSFLTLVCSLWGWGGGIKGIGKQWQQEAVCPQRPWGTSLKSEFLTKELVTPVLCYHSRQSVVRSLMSMEPTAWRAPLDSRQ